MNEQSIREAFQYGAGEAEPSAGMWERIDQESRVRSRTGGRRILRQAALATGVLLLLVAGTVALTPAARAAVILTVRGVVILWEGRLGKTDALLGWIDSRVGPQQLKEQGIQPVNEPWTDFADTREAAGTLGFSPAEAHVETAELVRVEGRKVRWGEHEVRGAQLTYQVNDGPDRYIVGTLADGVIENGGWVHRPYQGLDALMQSDLPPADPVTVDLGGTKALCMTPDPYGTNTCTFLQEGRQIAVLGPDREWVIRLATSIVAGAR